MSGVKASLCSRDSANGALRSTYTPSTSAPPADPAVHKLFANHSMLAPLTEYERSALLRWSRLRVLGRQKTIWREGDPASNVIFVLDGFVRVSRQLVDGHEAFLDIIGPADCAGDVTVIQRKSHDTGGTTLSPCRMVLIDARPFRQVFENNPERLRCVLQQANDRCNHVAEKLIESRTLLSSARLARELVRLSKYTAKFGGTTQFSLQLSQKELGAMTGICREVVCKYLQAWRNAGWIQTNNRNITWVDARALAKLSGNDEMELCRRVNDDGLRRGGVSRWVEARLNSQGCSTLPGRPC